MYVWHLERSVNTYTTRANTTLCTHFEDFVLSVNTLHTLSTFCLYCRYVWRLARFVNTCTKHRNTTLCIHCQHFAYTVITLPRCCRYVGCLHTLPTLCTLCQHFGLDVLQMCMATCTLCQHVHTVNTCTTHRNTTLCTHCQPFAHSVNTFPRCCRCVDGLHTLSTRCTLCQHLA